MEQTPPPEKIFYEDSNVTVTQSRFISNNKTYAMRNISSVSIFKIEQNRNGPILLLLVGIVLLFIDDARLIGVIAAAIGIFWLVNIKDEYSVRISTNSGEVNSLVSKDKVYIQKVIDALNGAIIHRG